MTYKQEYLAYVYPMAPCYWGGQNDVALDENGVPYIGCDFRPYINVEADLGDEEFYRLLLGCENKAYFKSDEYALYKALESNKELLDQITWEVRFSGGEFTHEDLVATQQTVHENLTSTSHPGYTSSNVTGLPERFFKDANMRAYFKFLRKNYNVWYICHQKEFNRVVIMGDDYTEVQKCMIRLQNKLRATAAGGYVYYDDYYNVWTTTRFESALDNYQYNWRHSEDFSAQLGMTEEDYRDLLGDILHDEEKVRDYILLAN
jgi:hypothetical protein